MRKPAVWRHGRKFWTPERFALLFTVLWSPLGLMVFIVGLFTMWWAWGMWKRAWNCPNYGYRPDGTMKTKFSELWTGRVRTE